MKRYTVTILTEEINPATPSHLYQILSNPANKALIESIKVENV